MIDSSVWRHSAKEPSVLGVHAIAWVVLALLAINPFKYAIIEWPLLAVFCVMLLMSLHARRTGTSVPILINRVRFGIGKVISYNQTLDNGVVIDEVRSLNGI